MGWYVYIIQSKKDRSYYKGYSMHPALRLIQHNNKECIYTSRKTPWVLVYVEEKASKEEAQQREKNLKKGTKERIEALLVHPKNIVHCFQ